MKNTLVAAVLLNTMGEDICSASVLGKGQWKSGFRIGEWDQRIEVVCHAPNGKCMCQARSGIELRGTKDTFGQGMSAERAERCT